MTSQRWIIAGWALLAVTLALAAVSLTQAMAAVSSDARILPLNPPHLVDFKQLLSGVIFAVVAGVTFFSALACFFWSALRESRQQMARVLELLDTPQ